MITNRYGLPQPFVDACGNPRQPKPGEIGVTALIGSPRVRALTMQHFDQLSEDVSDRVWALLGQSVHYVLEKAAGRDHLAEEYMTAEIDGFIIKGVPDLMDGDGVLSDYKVTSVWSFLLGNKAEWEAQLNVYAWLYARHGFTTEKLQIVAILRDWQKSKAKYDNTYPQTAVHVSEVDLWPLEKTEAYIGARVALHKAAEGGYVPDCTLDERWARPEKWAVKKKGNKKALRVLDSEDDAIRYGENSPYETEIEHRPGVNVKCEDYCGVSDFCDWWQAEKRKVVYSTTPE